MGMCECEIGFLRIKNRGQMLEILLTLHGLFANSLTQLLAIFCYATLQILVCKPWKRFLFCGYGSMNKYGVIKTY